MGSIVDLLSRHRNSGTSASSEALGSFISNRYRAGKLLSGAFLFTAFSAVIVNGGLTAAPAADTGNKAASTPQPAPTPMQVAPATTDQTPQLTAPSSTPADASGGLSTNITTTNGSTEVEVNGKKVAPSKDGSVNKTITTDQGTVHINVSQSSSGNNSDSSSVDYQSDSSSEQSVNRDE